MNPCIRAIVRVACYHQMEVVGIRNGFQGMIEDEVSPLSLRSVGNIIQKGGTILGSSRSKAFRTKEGRKKAYEVLQSLGIDKLIVLGGDGSMNAAAVLSREYPVQVIGVPCTIDNDLPGTDFSIGFDTAVETAVQCIDKIRDTADSHGRVFLIEVMGKNTGHIAIETGIAAGAEFVIIPEEDFKLSNLVKKIMSGYSRGKTGSIVIVAERKQPGFVLKLTEDLEKKVPVEVRGMILGHLQRGGSPSSFDRNLAAEFGAFSVELLRKEETRMMTATQNGRLIGIPFDQVVGRQRPADIQNLKLIDMLSI